MKHDAPLACGRYGAHDNNGPLNLGSNKENDMKKWLAIATILATGMMAGAANAADKLKACWVYVGPVGDFGYSYQHDQGRKAVEKELGDKVETVFLENVAEGPDAERAIERLAREGCKIIFTTSFGFMDPTLKVAAKYPDVKFEHATGYKKADNVAIYNARFYEGRYVMGQIAAKMSKSGMAGYIVSFPIPEVVMGINSFMLGAQSVNPNFKVKIVWVNSWYDPGKEADAAKVLFGQGADIMVQHTDSTAPLRIAEEQGKLGFGQSSDMIKFAPKAQLSANTDDWDPYYVARVKMVLDGTWKSEDTWGGMKDGMVVLAPFTNMPDDVKAMAEKSVADIKAGALLPFGGVITKQDGSTVGEAGKSLPDGDLLGMNWYVKGIDDKLPQ
jgi:simple sugar transport system substrate-binding protein